MSSNPNDAVGTNGAYGGRTSVNAFNDVLASYTRGVMSGWACSPSSGLTVTLGGNGTTRDVAIAEDNAGNKTTINNISGSPISVTLDAAPGSNSRIDSIIAYVDNPPNGTSTDVDNPGACGIIKVNGTVSSSPSAPDDNAIRTAITGDGASGTTAYYVVLANITVASGTTDLVAGNIVAGATSSLKGNAVVSSNNIDYTTLPYYGSYTANISVPKTDTTVATYIIPSDGYYFVSASLNLHTVSSQHTSYVEVNKNGTGIDQSYVGIESNSWGNLNLARTFSFTTGDSITISIRDTVGISASANTRIRISIFRIG